ncbi:MAG: type II toxin-antitoxin system VapC family toxin [Kiritimatiellia bacterium]
MIAVLDASAAVSIVLKRSDSTEARKAACEADELIAPGLFVCEVANTFWKYYHLSDMALAACEQAVEKAVALPDRYVSGEELHMEAFSLACLTDRTVYDMLYLVLARRNNAVLVTVDESLKETARKQSVRVV